MTPLGPDAFYSAKLRLTRAQEHLDELTAQIDRFFGEKPYTRVCELDPNDTHKIYKIRLTKPFPFRWRILATEIIEHARASIDHATWASAFLHTKNPNLEFGTFAFGKDAAKLADRIKGLSKDCPPEVQSLLNTFNAYPGGNDLLYVLNDICNLSKHALVTFLAGAFVSGEIRGKAFNGPVDFFEPIILDIVKNEIPYMRVLKDADPEHEIEITPPAIARLSRAHERSASGESPTRHDRRGRPNRARYPAKVPRHRIDWMM
jgi:hypothetical protein